MVLVVKFLYGNDIRRVTADKNFTWAEVTDLVTSLFEITGKFSLKYKDDEGDLITVSTDRELEEAFTFHKTQSTVRFTVVAEAKKPEVNNNNSQEAVIELDLENILPIIQNLIETFAPRFGGNHWGGRGWRGGRCPFQQNPFQQPQQQPQQQQQNCAFPSNAHVGVTCDGCGTSPIVGIRHKCNTCPDYDLCEQCDKKEVHREHTFTKISEPIRYWRGCHQRNWGQQQQSNEPVVHNATCDICNDRIRGIRYKCTVCPDFDLCETCEKGKDNLHPEHSFEKITTPRRWGGCPRRWGNCQQNQCQQQPQSPKVPPQEGFDIKPTAPKKEEVEPKQSEEVKKTEEVKAVVEEPKKTEEPKKVEEAKKVEEPKVEQPKKAEEQPKTPLEEKLKQLQDMGFNDTQRNLGLLIKHKGDTVRVVMELLAI